MAAGCLSWVFTAPKNGCNAGCSRWLRQHHKPSYLYELALAKPNIMSAKRRLVIDFLKIADLSVVFATLCACVLTTATGLEIQNWYGALQTRVELGNVLFVCAYLLAWHWILAAYGLYHSYRISASSR